jgi:hypothetical protein
VGNGSFGFCLIYTTYSFSVLCVSRLDWDYKFPSFLNLFCSSPVCNLMSGNHSFKLGNLCSEISQPSQYSLPRQSRVGWGCKKINMAIFFSIFFGSSPPSPLSSFNSNFDLAKYNCHWQATKTWMIAFRVLWSVH